MGGAACPNDGLEEGVVGVDGVRGLGASTTKEAAKRAANSASVSPAKARAPSTAPKPSPS